MYDELHQLHIYNFEYINYKEQTLLESQDIFAQLASATFSITEILLTLPDTKDEQRYACWDPFKSKIVAYVNSDIIKFNLQMMIETCDRRIVRRDDQSPLTQYDQQLVSAIKESFKIFKVSV